MSASCRVCVAELDGNLLRAAPFSAFRCALSLCLRCLVSLSLTRGWLMSVFPFPYMGSVPFCLGSPPVHVEPHVVHSSVNSAVLAHFCVQPPCSPGRSLHAGGPLAILCARANGR